MAEAPQGLFHWPGIKSILSASFTLGHGISPSVCSMRIAPQFTGIRDIDTLTLTYGNVRLRFFDCRIDKVTGDIGDDGREVWELTILDRRWRWKGNGKIGGYYNVRDNETGGTSLIQDTERTPRQLAELCLQAMGERGFDVRALPNFTRPAVEWDYTDPAGALQQLCDDLGCRVVLTFDNTVRIDALGRGKKLPSGRGHGILSESKTADPPERPDRIVAVAGRTRLNVDMPLEPLGRDIDGELKPLDDLSYTPKNAANRPDWSLANLPDMNAIGSAKCRELAKETVYRIYRIKPPFFVPLQGATKGRATKVENLREILPIEDEQVFKSPNTREPKLPKKNLPAIVYGIWNDGHEATANVMERLDPTVIDAVESLWPRDKGAVRNQKLAGLVTVSFSIDKERGLVIFDEPLVRYYEETNGIVRYPARLMLRTAVCLRHAETLEFHRYERERKAKRQKQKTGTQPRYIIKDEIAAFAGAIYDKNYNFKRIETNEKEVIKNLDYYLDAAEYEYQLLDPRETTFAGFKQIEADGCIQQVSWSVDESGFARTRASYNREQANTPLPNKERRLYESIQAAIASQRKGAAGKKWEISGPGFKT